jgi:hypothetical protein
MNGFYDFSDLQIGMRVNVEGEYQPDGTLRARQISIKDDGEEDEIAARIEAVDAESGTLRLLGLTLRLGGGVEIKDVDKAPLGIEALSPGMRVKTKGHALGDGSFEPLKLKLRQAAPDDMDEIEGDITHLDPDSKALTVLGFRILCDADVEIEA